MTCVKQMAIALFAGALSLAPAHASEAKNENCTPSKWGPEDEIGSANLITPESVLESAKLIKRGKTKNLGIVIDSSTPAFGPRSLHMQIVQPGQEFGREAFPNGFNYNDDVFQGWFGIGSQIDGLAHIGQHGTFYNCYRGEDFVQITGVTKLGIEKLPPIVGRAVLIDMAGYIGVNHLEGGQYFTAEDVRGAVRKQGTSISKGDIVIFNTGWTEHVLPTNPELWGATQPGISEDVATYLASLDVLAVGADTWALDVVPSEKEGRPFQGHIILLKEHGIYILETMNVGPLVKEGVDEFLFVLGPVRIRGAVQSFVNPTAIY